MSLELPDGLYPLQNGDLEIILCRDYFSLWKLLMLGHRRVLQLLDRYQSAGAGKITDNYRVSRWTAFSISENGFIIKLFSILHNFQRSSRETGLHDNSHRHQPLLICIQRRLESCKWVQSLFLLMQCEEAQKKIKIHSLKPDACAEWKKVSEWKLAPRPSLNNLLRFWAGTKFSSRSCRA